MSQFRHFLAFPRVMQGYFAPSYPLIRDIFYPTMEEVAFMLGLSVDIKEGNKEVHVYQGRKYYGTTKCRSMDKPATIVGFKIGRAFIDEIDTLPTDKALTAWRKIIARLRHRHEGVKNGADVTTTPEGFKFVYQQFKQKIDADKKEGKQSNYGLVRARTYDNRKNLPDDYISSLYDTYPSQLVDAYIDGKFVNLTSGSVYHCYDEKNNTTKVHQPGEPISIGMDFNVRNMSATISVHDDDGMYAVDQFTGVLDTPAMIDLIKDRYRDTNIIIRPDASGRNTSSKSASLSDISLLEQAGFMVDAPRKNPSVKDRVNAVNAGLEKGKLFVNKNKCPQLDLALQQQVYDKNGSPEKRPDSNIDDINDSFGYDVCGVMPIVRHTTKINVRHAT